jgi:hypothetical protein
MITEVAVNLSKVDVKIDGVHLVSSNATRIVTTPKLPIIDNRCELPSRPAGDFVWNMAIVFDDEGVADVYENIALEVIDTVPFLRFLDVDDFTGQTAVVSYLKAESIA